MSEDASMPTGTSAAESRATARTSMAYRVPYADTDQMGVVYYANYLVYFERVRNEVLRACGLTYKEMESLGILLPVIEAHCDYRSPAGYDYQLEITGWFELINPARIRACCEVRHDGRILATGHTVHVVLSGKTRRPMRLSAEMISRIFDRSASVMA